MIEVRVIGVDQTIAYVEFWTGNQKISSVLVEKATTYPGYKEIYEIILKDKEGNPANCYASVLE